MFSTTSAAITIAFIYNFDQIHLVIYCIIESIANCIGIEIIYKIIVFVERMSLRRKSTIIASGNRASNNEKSIPTDRRHFVV